MNRIGYADIRFRLLNDMLVKVDRMSLASSLEVCSPFLDHKLVEFSTLLASDLKFRRWQGKRLLRSALESALPPESLAKPKKGFSVPLREWFRTGLRDWVKDYLNGGDDDGVLDKKGIQVLLRDHSQGKKDDSAAIWILLMYVAWWKQIMTQLPK